MKFNTNRRILLLFLLVSTLSFAQKRSQTVFNSMEDAYTKNTTTPFTPQELKMLQEVYGNALQEEILDKPQRVKDIKHLLRNRIVYFQEQNPKNFKTYQLLSSAPLFDVFVDGLERDMSFDKETFNPLKYQMLFYTNSAIIYRIDNTTNFILIRPQVGR